MFLQVVPDARDVRVHLDPVGQPHARDLAQRRVGLLGRRRLHLRAHAALLRRTFERARLGLEALLHASPSDQLIYRRHVISLNLTTVVLPRLAGAPVRRSPILKDRSAPASCPARLFARLSTLAR